MTSSYKLTYFNIRGRGEVTRYLFKMKDVEFEDNRVDFAEGTWPELKQSMTSYMKLQLYTCTCSTCMYQLIDNTYRGTVQLLFI